MMNIVFLQEALWKQIWAYLRFCVRINHVGIAVGDNKFIHLSYGGVKISPIPDKRYKVMLRSFVTYAKTITTIEQIKEAYIFGDFKNVKLDKLRLIFPFLPKKSDNTILCNEFVDDVALRYGGVIINSLQIAKEIV